MEIRALETPLKVSGLNKKYGNTEVLRNLDLQVSRGAVHGLVGLNGSGKTTTLNCILGLQSYNSGEISVLGHQPSRLYQSNGNVVAIFDTPCIHPNLTVRQVLEQAKLLCTSPVRTCQDVEELLSIRKYSDYKIKHLSLGNRRRASIAQALLGNPAFIVLDEPFNGLDAEGVDDVLALIKQLNQEQGISFLLSSHQLPYLEQVCSHLAILHKGEIALSDEISNIFENKYTQLSISCNESQRAVLLLQNDPDIQIKNLEELKTNNFSSKFHLELELQSIASSQINHLLVNQGIEVHELIIRKQTLSSLFRDLTSGTEQ